MDEHQTSLQSNISDAASDDLSISILGKMKNLLPDSISNWLSPKVDKRRRPHDSSVLDSEEDETDPNRSVAFGNTPSALASHNNNYAQRVSTIMSAAPPTKRQRMLIPNQHDTFLTNQTSVPRRESIISSTLIEDTAPSTLYRPHENGTETNRRSLDRIGTALDNNNPYRSSPLAATASFAETRRSYNELNFLPSRSSQPTTSSSTYRAERDLDETSSNRSTNPFTLNNDSMAVNFSAHLQKSKSLFSNKSYASQSSRSLSNYRQRRQQNSSLYRSTSSLCDNNSNTSSNASSAMSSPFYSGQTTFGGASAQSKRFASAFHSQHHRAKIPSRLVPSNLSKSTSALNVSTDTSAMPGLSTTAKRILDVMNQSSTPLGDVRRVSNALPTSMSATLSSGLNRRLSSLLEVSTEAEHDPMKRRLVKPNTPYNRPVGRSMAESCFTQGLNVPSMPQLLQLQKKLTENTIKGRELAAQSNSILNKPVDSYKLPERAASTDLDATNNNHKSSTTTNNKHVSKIRNNIISKQRKAGKMDEHEMPPEPVDLPNVRLERDDKEIKIPTTLFPAPKAPTIESRKIDEFVAKSKPADAPALTFKFTPTVSTATKIVDKLFSSPFTSVAATATAAASASTFTSSTSTMPSKSNNLFESATLETKAPPSPSSSSSSSSSSSVEIISDEPAVKVTRADGSSKFSTPIYVKRAATCVETDSFKLQEKQNYKFSEPIVINARTSAGTAMPSSSSSSSSSSTSSPWSTTPTTKPPALTSIEPKKPEFSFAKQVPSTDPTKCDDALRALAAKQTQNKWSCSSCFTPNENSATKCVCCGVSNSSAAASAPSTSSFAGAKASISSSSGAAAIVDDVFKSIVAKQKQSKWVCDSCMADNDVAQVKCLCCGENKPDSGGSAPAAPAISSSSSKVDDLFKSIAAKQKSSTWACSVCETKNDLSKSKCVCCQQAKESDTTVASSTGDASSSKPKFSFGSGGIDLGAPSGKFSFGSKPVVDAKATASTSNTTANTTATATPQFTFGTAKPDDKTKSMASPITFGSFKTDSATTSSAAAATTATAAAPKFSFGSPSTGTKPSVPLGTFAFGGAKPTVDSTSSSSSTSTSTAAVTFGAPAQTTSTASSASSLAITTAAQSSTTATSAPAVDDIFKKIVSQQTAKWSCTSCMAQNNQTDSECACCNTPKDGAPAGEKRVDSTVKSKFSFGSPSTSTFSFGSKPAATPSTSFQFGTPAQQPTVTSSNTVTSTSSTFSLSSSQPTFGSPFAIQKTNAQSSTVTSTATTTASKPFQFGFGSSAPSFGSPKFGSPAAVSSDVTDTATPSAPTTIGETKGVTILENVLVQSPAPSAEKPKPMFSFGAPIASDDKSKSISLKRPSTDVSTEPNLFKTPTLAATAPSAPLSTPTPFVFGQPSSTTNTLGSSSTLATNPLSNIATTSASVPAPAFSFGTNNSTSQSATPAFGFNPPAPNAFATNAFSFGASSTTSTFGSPVQNTASTEQAQPQSNLFQFGASSNQSAAPATDAFRFNANAAPSFNFSATTTQPQADANSPFQFSSAAPTNNLFAPQSSSATAIKDRRKLRPVRRVNRP